MQPSRLIIFPLLLVVLAGCESRDFNRYTSPEVTGRVLAAGTHLPIADVRVHCAVPNNPFETFDPPKGGQLLMQPAPVLTDTDGRFSIASKSALVFFRSPIWWTAPLVFSHSGYESFQTNYTAANVTSHSAAGAPVVDAGDILLQPLAR